MRELQSTCRAHTLTGRPGPPRHLHALGCGGCMHATHSLVALAGATVMRPSLVAGSHRAAAIRQPRHANSRKPCCMRSAERQCKHARRGAGVNLRDSDDQNSQVPHAGAKVVCNARAMGDGSGKRSRHNCQPGRVSMNDAEEAAVAKGEVRTVQHAHHNQMCLMMWVAS